MTTGIQGVAMASLSSVVDTHPGPGQMHRQPPGIPKKPANPWLGCLATVHSSHAETDQFSVADVASRTQEGLTTGVAQLAGEVMR